MINVLLVGKYNDLFNKTNTMNRSKEFITPTPQGSLMPPPNRAKFWKNYFFSA